MSLKLPVEPSQTSVTVRPEPKISFVQKVIKGETYLVMAHSSVELEDEFSNLYFTTQDQTKLFLMPPFDPAQMLQLAQTNNTLNQCIEAMEVNVDGTGIEFVKAKESVDIDLKEKEAAEAFFGEPYPQQSFVKIRRKLRREVESVGYGYVEVLRAADGGLVGLRNVNTHTMRMVKLDSAIQVKRKVVRGGKEVELTLWERQRRFGRRVAMTNLVYYKEFGVERHLHRDTGKWEDPNDKDSVVPPEKRATELLVVGLHPDVNSPYFVPRWINQLPSVVGSRKAEEQNLEYFDAGGMPPAIIFIQGGVLASDAADQLKGYLSGKNKNKHRAVVVEAQSSSGSLESAGSVQVKVERFGGEKANDALYEKYDKAAEEHVRIGFRLPPLFLGKAADYNFATAVTAYMVAEAQVFKPERELFDELLNSTVVKAMGWKTLKVKSKPITLQDVANQMAALTLANTAAAIKPDSLIESLNAITGLHMEALPPPPAGVPTIPGAVADGKGGHQKAPDEIPKEPSALDHAQVALTHSQAAANDAKAGLKPGTTAAALAKAQVTPQTKTPGNTPERPMKKTAIELINLAKDYAALTGLVQKRELSEDREVVVKFEIQNLGPEDLQVFNTLLSSYAFGSSSPDLVSLAHHSHAH
jgi:PBSX family phage portal protein